MLPHAITTDIYNRGFPCRIIARLLGLKLVSLSSSDEDSLCSACFFPPRLIVAPLDCFLGIVTLVSLLSSDEDSPLFNLSLLPFLSHHLPTSSLLSPSCVCSLLPSIVAFVPQISSDSSSLHPHCLGSMNSCYQTLSFLCDITSSKRYFQVQIVSNISAQQFLFIQETKHEQPCIIYYTNSDVFNFYLLRKFLVFFCRNVYTRILLVLTFR